MARGRSTARRAEIAERRTRAIALRIRGEPWDAIARQLGYKTPGAACQDVSRAMEQRIKEQGQQADVLREVELARLDALEAAAWEVLERRHVTVSGGKIVTDGDEPLLDDGPTLAAIDRLLKIQERRAKLTGLDSPTKIDATVTADTESPRERLRQLLEEARQNRRESEHAVEHSNGSNGNGSG